MHPPRALTARALGIGLALSLVVAAYSTYAGLKVGGVYWPIITATLLALAVGKLFGGLSPQELSIAATAASTGGLLAAGVLFTVPAAWLLGVAIPPLEVSLVAILGGLLGVAFTLPLREEMLERLALPYPDGTATAAVIAAGDAGGRQVRPLLAAAGVAAAFTALRDGFRLLPAVINLESLGSRYASRLSLGSSVSLVPFAGGFLIGPLFSGVWFAGAVLSYLVALPLLVANGRFESKLAAVHGLTQPAGIGVIVGASVAYFLLKGLPSLHPLLARWLGGGRSRGRAGLWLAGGALAVVVVSLALDLPLWLTLVALIAAFMVAYIAARIAGELNIDPMEIFAIAILLLVVLFVRLEVRTAVVFAALLCLAAGMAGDFMQDLKAGSLVGTRPRDQAIAQLVSVVLVGSVLGLLLAAMDRAYTIGSVELPAPQAVALAGIVEAGSVSAPLAWGGLAGALLALLALWRGLGILPVALGIGLYAPIELSLPLFLGGLIRLATERRGRGELGRLLAAGAIGGEGVVGVALALARMWR